MFALVFLQSIDAPPPRPERPSISSSSTPLSPRTTCLRLLAPPARWLSRSWELVCFFIYPHRPLALGLALCLSRLYAVGCTLALVHSSYRRRVSSVVLLLRARAGWCCRRRGRRSLSLGETSSRAPHPTIGSAEPNAELDLHLYRTRTTTTNQPTSSQSPSSWPPHHQQLELHLPVVEAEAAVLLV